MDNENPVQNAQTLQGAEQMTGLDNPSSLTMSAEDLNTQPQTPPPAQPQPQVNEQPNFAEQFLNSLQEEETALEQTDMSLRSSIASLLPELEGEGQALAQEEARLGVFNMRKNLQGINNRILSLNAELYQDDVSLAAGIAEIKNKPIAMEFITGESAALEDQARIARAFKVSEINMLNAQALGMQGNIALAQDQAQKAVDAKYSPIREALATRQARLELIQPLLTAEDKKQAANMQRKWDLALRDLDRREATETEAKNLAFSALEFGAPQDKVSEVLNTIDSGDYTLGTVIDTLGAYLKDPVKEAELTLKNLQISNEIQKQKNAEMAKEMGILTEKQYETALDIRKQVVGEKSYQSMETIEQSIGKILTSGNQAKATNSGAADIALVNAFQKLIDEGAVVREGDVALLQSAQSLYQNASVKAARIKGSGAKFTDEFRQDLMDTAEKLYEAQLAGYSEKIEPLKANAEGRGIDFNEYIVPDFKSIEDVKERIPQEFEEDSTSILDNLVGGAGETSYGNYFPQLNNSFNQFGL